MSTVQIENIFINNYSISRDSDKYFNQIKYADIAHKLTYISQFLNHLNYWFIKNEQKELINMCQDKCETEQP